MILDMGLIKRLKWVDGSKKQCRSLYWRARAAVKKAVKKQNNVKFQYDPSSYALNFDDGCCHVGAATFEVNRERKNLDCSEEAMWVYVVWVESSRRRD